MTDPSVFSLDTMTGGLKRSSQQASGRWSNATRDLRTPGAREPGSEALLRADMSAGTRRMSPGTIPDIRSSGRRHRERVGGVPSLKAFADDAALDRRP